MTDEMPLTLSEIDEDDIRVLLIGRRVVAAEEGSFSDFGSYGRASGRLTLDDGTVIYVRPNDGGCSCGGGDYELTHLAKVDNIITDVKVVDEALPGSDGFPRTSYRIYVVADNEQINLVQVDGDDGSGYYGTGYELFIHAPKTMTEQP